MEFNFNKIKNSKIFRIVIIISLGTLLIWAVMKYTSRQGGKLAKPKAGISKRITKKRETKKETKKEAEKIKELLGKEGLFGKEEIIPVRAYKVSKVDFKDSLPVVGSLKSIPEIDLKFEISGVINSINFEEGDRVRKGDVIATLKQDDAKLELAWAQAKYNTALSEIETAKKRLEVLEKLYDAGAIIKSKLEESELELETAKRRAEQAQIEVESAREKLKKTYLYAPRDGVLSSKEVEVGEFVTPNEKVITLLATENLFVEVGIIEKDIYKIKPHQQAKITVDTYPDKAFFGTITSVFPAIEGRSRTLTARIKVRDPQGLLLPGMFARVQIYVFSKPNAIVVPSTAVSIQANRYQVSVIENKRARTRMVNLEYLTTDYAVIKSGLKEGEIVVVETPGLRKLKDGTKVEIIELQEQAFELE